MRTLSFYQRAWDAREPADDVECDEPDEPTAYALAYDREEARRARLRAYWAEHCDDDCNDILF